MEKLQKHAWATNRSTCETSALDRELVINTGTADSNGPEAIVVVSGSPYRFPTKNQLATSAGMSLIGANNTSFINISGTDGQTILSSIDDNFTIKKITIDHTNSPYTLTSATDVLLAKTDGGAIIVNMPIYSNNIHKIKNWGVLSNSVTLSSSSNIENNTISTSGYIDVMLDNVLGWITLNKV
jgi:hypothetical protein